jgi:hypothetical protein
MIDELNAVLFTSNIDICCITDTWLSNVIPTEFVDIDGCVCYCEDRCSGHGGGGVVCYVRQNISCSRLQILESPNLESMWFLYQAHCMPRCITHIVIGIVYHPLRGDSSIATSHIINNLDCMSCQHPGADVVLLSGFNQLPDEYIQQYPLKQTVHLPTRGEVTFDQIFSNLYDYCLKPVLMLCIANSDHFTVMMKPKPVNQFPHCKRIRCLIHSND